MKNIKAFTLVELIVVITILAILATLGFIAFSGNTYKAEKVKQQSNVKNIEKLLATKLTSGQDINDFLSGSLMTVNGVNTGTTVTVGSGAYKLADLKYRVGELNFFKLQINGDSFKNNQNKKYIFAYTKTPDRLYYQIASEKENNSGKNEVILFGRYSQISSTDAKGLISEKGYNIGVENGQSLTGSLY